MAGSVVLEKSCTEKKIGIVGLGAIGKVVARCAGGFAMEVLAYDPYMNESYAAEHGIKSVSFEELIAQCDYISMHLPLNDQTYHMINKETFSKMKDGVILINASRGGIVDEAAAKEAVESGKLGGLGLDASRQSRRKILLCLLMTMSLLRRIPGRIQRKRQRIWQHWRRRT